MTDGPFRIVTINTGKGDGPYSARLDVLADALAALSPDLVLAQEVFEATSGTASTARRLASSLGMASAFHAVRRKPRDVDGERLDSWSGLATLSRWPLREVRMRALPDDPADGDRAVLLAAVETPRGLVRTANTHFTHLRGRDDLRVLQAREVLADVWWRGDALARVLAGDLNARPGHDLHALLRSGEAGWRALDAYEAAGDPDTSVTIRHSSATGVVEARLDYIYLLGTPGTAPAARVRAARVVLDQPVSGVMPSDHFGVLVDLEWADASDR
ncbi:MAG: endonuclease/exonuclease/phosphatase family protein [Dehalococcoidia bacterium]|nr:endonuclease/exonuclease/phosphatase family protein [Dehalococcoidia bacterium]